MKGQRTCELCGHVLCDQLSGRQSIPYSRPEITRKKILWISMKWHSEAERNPKWARPVARLHGLLRCGRQVGDSDRARRFHGDKVRYVDLRRLRALTILTSLETQSASILPARASNHRWLIRALYHTTLVSYCMMSLKLRTFVLYFSPIALALANISESSVSRSSFRTMAVATITQSK